jgi:hypothetical protein
MPATVAIAVVALSVVVAVQIALALFMAGSRQVGWGMWSFAGVLWILILAGVARGSRLAWLWARYLTMILGMVLVATVLTRVRELPPTALAVSLLGLALPLFTAGIALGRRSAYPYFGLVCPTCSALTGLGADFLFRKARCRKCGAVW